MSRLVLLMGALLVAVGAGALLADEAAESEPEGECLREAIPQEACPVMGGPVNEEIYVDHEGRRVYFCCAGCVDAFEQDSERYLAELDEQLLRRLSRRLPQKRCPVMGGRIDEDISAEHDGRRVYFCCAGCPEQFSQHPDKYVGKLDEALLRRLLRSVPQKECPVMGGAVNKDIHVEHDGRLVYFCCAGCPEEFSKDREQYLQKLDEQLRQALLECVLSGNCPTWQPAEQAGCAGGLVCDGCVPAD